MEDFKNWELNEQQSNLGFFNYNKRKPYRMFFDEKGEKKIYVKPDGKINQKVIDSESLELGLFILGGIAFNENQTEFESNKGDEIKGSSFVGDFFSVIDDHKIGSVLKELTGKCYIHFYITDFIAYILEDITADLFRDNIQIGLYYEAVKEVINKFFRKNYKINDLLQLEIPVFRIQFLEKFFEEFINFAVHSDDYATRLVMYEVLKLDGDYSNVIAFFKYSHYYTQYFQQISNFGMHSKLYFDNEQYVEKMLKKYVNKEEPKIFKNLNDTNVFFIDSKDNINIQYSDIIVMLLYKLVSELYRYESYEEFYKKNTELFNKRNYRLFMKLIKKSVEENDNFIGSFMNFNDRQILEYLIINA